MVPSIACGSGADVFRENICVVSSDQIGTADNDFFRVSSGPYSSIWSQGITKSVSWVHLIIQSLVKDFVAFILVFTSLLAYRIRMNRKSIPSDAAYSPCHTERIYTRPFVRFKSRFGCFQVLTEALYQPRNLVSVQDRSIPCHHSFVERQSQCHLHVDL